MTDEVQSEINDANRAEFQQDMQAGLERMMFEVKKKLKGNSKNEIIRICCALLVENYSLKQSLPAQSSPENQVETPN